jgi:hypothetical protein
MKKFLFVLFTLTVLFSCEKEEPVENIPEVAAPTTPEDEFIKSHVAIFTDEYHYESNEEITMHFRDQGYPETLWHGRCDTYTVIFNKLYKLINNEWIFISNPSFCTYAGPSNNMPVPGYNHDLNYKFKIFEAGWYKFDYAFIGDQTQDTLIFESNDFYIME